MYDVNSILSFLRDYERDRQVLGIQKGRFWDDPKSAINHEALNSMLVKPNTETRRKPAGPANQTGIRRAS